MRAPAVQGAGSELPALLGLQSMQSNNGVVETGAQQKRLSFPGPGGYEITWSPGTIHFDLESAPSGHLLIRVDNYDKLKPPSGGLPAKQLTLLATGGPAATGGDASGAGKEVCHLLHAVARSHKLVCRSSFGSELLAACGAADGLQAFLLTMHEMVHGPASPSEARRLREEGGYAVPAELVVDGMSVFSALLMDPVKPPSENSMAGHLWWLADQLRTKQIDDLVWCDTRDMRADPMTKGTISRDLILDVMAGNFAYVHDTVRFSVEKRKKTVPSSRYSPLKED